MIRQKPVIDLSVQLARELLTFRRVITLEVHRVDEVDRRRMRERVITVHADLRCYTLGGLILLVDDRYQPGRQGM